MFFIAWFLSVIVGIMLQMLRLRGKITKREILIDIIIISFICITVYLIIRVHSNIFNSFL